MKSIGRFSLLIATVLLICAGAVAGENRAHPPVLGKLNDYKNLDVNQVNAVVNSDGVFADMRQRMVAGLEWPKGSGKTAVFTSGLWLIGKHRPSGHIRTAVMYYWSEYQPGPLLETFNTTTNNDTLPTGRVNDDKYRLYKISAGDATTPAGTNPDYDQWPGDLGAPYIDVNGDGQWTLGVDRPKFYGDQQIWMVINDASNARHSAIGVTPPMGMEVRCLYYGFNDPGVLGNVAFLKYQIINKSDADYDSCYLSQWSDIDLGYADDDLPGCDTTLSLGYVYNGFDFDETAHGYGSTPPADGFALFQGPKVPGGPTDSAIADGKWYKGFKNLPMTSYIAYTSNVFPQINDPPAGSPGCASIAYDYQRGLAGTVHQTLISPTSHQPMYKWFSGDPVTGTGDLPGNFPLGVFRPQDIWIMLSSGPFTLAKGDTQAFVVAFVIAQDTGRLSSVRKLKEVMPAVVAKWSTLTGVKEDGKSETRPAAYTLGQNYPNPFNPSTTIRYELPGSSVVRLNVYDILGRVVAVLVNERKAPGSYEVKFDGSNLASGVYFYRLRAGSFVQTKRLLLLK